jgi:hypothetical protein
MYCSDCGKKIDVSMQFCPFCGSKNKLCEMKVAINNEESEHRSDEITLNEAQEKSENDSLIEKYYGKVALKRDQDIRDSVDGSQKTNTNSDSFIDSSSNNEKVNENESTLVSASFENEEISDYIGVHGWLKFLVICLTFLSPLSNMRSVIESISLLNIAYTFSILMWLIIDVVIIIWSFVTGVMLWKITKNAKNNALAFFNFQILISIALLFVYLPSTDYSSLLISISSIISGLIWFGYLKKSKRVRATYK